MKLSNLPWRNRFKRLRVDMGARQSEWKSMVNWEPIYIDKRLAQTGWDFSLNKIEFNGNEAFEYKGRRVVIYIRDQNQPIDSEREKLNKVHLVVCNKLQDMIENDRFGKFVAATRTDGSFAVNFLQGNRLIKNGAERKLYVCKYCLNLLCYKNYCKCNSVEQDRIRESFDFVEFFQIYGSLVTKPRHTDKTAPLNNYTKDWSRVARTCKEKQNWTCEECKTHYPVGKKRQFLHVHHINALKYDNSNKNLRVLCINCHTKEYHHEHLKNSPQYAQFQRLANLESWSNP